MKNIVVYLLGGTILSSYDERSAQVKPDKNAKVLLIGLISDSTKVNISINQFCNLPGPHISPDIAFELAVNIKSELSKSDIDGIVVVQGTDTIEETAYLLDLLLDSNKPVVFTGAMKSQNELYSDSKGNFLGAVEVASSPYSYRRGVLVYFNQEIHKASRVLKYHANNIAAFSSPGSGPAGILYNQQIMYYSGVGEREHFNVNAIDSKVALIKASCGMDALFIDSCINARFSGIVIEGFGAGNLTPAMTMGVARALKTNIPVILVSRCYDGMTTSLYDYEGGSARLYKMGVILGAKLNGPKARIKLMVVLGHTRNIAEIRSFFES